MAYNMTFLFIPDGALDYTDSVGSGTMTGTGTTFVTGKWSGVQAVEVAAGDSLTTPATTDKIDTTDGWAAVLYQRDSDPGADQYLFKAGTAGTADYIAGRVNNSLAVAQGVMLHGSAPVVLDGGAEPAIGVWSVLFLDWTGQSLGVAQDTAALTSGTVAPATDPTGSTGGTHNTISLGMYDVDGAYHLHGRIAAVAIGTGSLTANERAAMVDVSAPWTWNMVYTPPVVDAGPDAGVTQNTPWTQGGSFTDSDSASWTATVDYGDGAGPAPLALTGTTFALSHTYTATGEYTVTVAVTDNGGQTGSDTVTVTVSEGPTLGAFVVMSVPGTDASAPVITLPGGGD